LQLGKGAGAVTTPAGDLSAPHIYAANRDEVVTGPQPEAIFPGRSPGAAKRAGRESGSQ